MIMGNEGLIRIAINGRERYKESIFQEEEAIDDMADAFPGKKRPKEEEFIGMRNLMLLEVSFR